MRAVTHRSRAPDAPHCVALPLIRVLPQCTAASLGCSDSMPINSVDQASVWEQKVMDDGVEDRLSGAEGSEAAGDSIDVLGSIPTQIPA